MDPTTSPVFVKYGLGEVFNVKSHIPQNNPSLSGLPSSLACHPTNSGELAISFGAGYIEPKKDNHTR